MTTGDPATGDPASADVLVVGASARAAAWSALRAGLRPTAIDQFGDADIRDVAPVAISRRYPADLPEVAASVPNVPWIYGGALENEPRIVEAISQARTLWGNGPEVLKAVRDPVLLVDTLSRGRRLTGLEVRRHDAPPPRNGAWVLRPRRSAAGRGIRLWTGETTIQPTAADVFQRFADGTSCSAVFVGTATAAEFVGITRQLHATTNRFEWRGNVGPFELPESTTADLLDSADRLVTAHGLRGLFGLDFVVDLTANDPVPYVTEVNPRYTASVELLEFATGRPLLAEHARVFDERIAAPDRRDPTNRAVVKFVGFATRNLVVHGLSGDLGEADPWTPPRVADRPVPGTRIVAGSPLCTIFGVGDSHGETIASLEETARSATVRTDAGDISLRELVEWANFDR